MNWTPEHYGPFLVPVPDAPQYAVTDLGHVVNRVKRYRLEPHLNQSQASRKAGARIAYYRVGIPLPGRPDRKVMVHRLVCLAFHGPPPTPAHQCAHDDGNPHHNLPGNLAWKTALENAADTLRHGNRIRGEKHRSSILKEPDVLSLRALAKAGKLNCLAEAKRLRCNRRTISAAASGETWGWLQAEPCDAANRS